MKPKINWKPSAADIRKFGLTILIGFGLIGGLMFFKGLHKEAEWIWAAAAVVCLVSLLVPVAAKPFYWLWMTIALIMGSIMSRVVLTVIYFFVISPVALLFKILGRDQLRRKKPMLDTYWENHPEVSDKKSYEHLF